MPRHEFSLSDQQTSVAEFTASDTRVVHVDGELRLRQRGPTGAWDPLGVYATADFLLHTWQPSALKELTGFCALVSEDRAAGDKVLFRLATDAGAPLWWDGSSWVAATLDSEWNPEEDIDAGLSSFPVGCSVSFYVRLESGDGTSTPRLKSILVFWEAAYDPSEDVIRSLHAKVLAETEINAEWCDIYEDPVISIDVADPVWAVDDPVEVYNVDNDPCFETNLFASRVGATLQLTSHQTGEILVRYRGRLPQAHIASDSDFEREALPALIIRNTSQPRVRDWHNNTFEEPLRGKKVVRLRTFPARHNYVMEFSCAAPTLLHTKKLADAIRRVFDAREFVRSLALDEDMPLVALENVVQTNRVEDQLFERTVELTLSVLEWMPAFEDIPMALEIIQRIRPFTFQVIRAAD